MPNHVIIFGTTLRDGEQSPGVTMNPQEKLRMARQLRSLGVDVIEASFPASSVSDFETVHTIVSAVTDVQITTLARCNKNDTSRAWQVPNRAHNPRIHALLATSPIHMEHKFRKIPGQVVGVAVVAVRHAAKYTNNVEFSAESASYSNPDFLVCMFTEVINAGATIINVPDTVSYTQPDGYGKLIKYVIENTPNFHKAVFSVHYYDDLGLTVANGLSAIQNGTRQAEVTFCDIGERTGSISLEGVVMAMRARPDVYGVDCSVQNEQPYPACRPSSPTIGRPITVNKAIVGGNVFAHEFGIHQDGMLKNCEIYKIMVPQSIGRKSMGLIIGKHSGRNAVRTRLEELSYRPGDEQVDVVFAAVKDFTDKKANVHGEDLEALAFSEVYRLPDHYRLGNVSVQVTMGPSMSTTAAMVIQAGEEGVRRTGFGTGPIDATFNVISQIVSRAPDLEQFSINAIAGGTDAQGGVTVRLREGGHSATGRGSDSDITVVSVKAYIDTLNRLDHRERDVLRAQEATDESVINTCN